MFKAYNPYKETQESLRVMGRKDCPENAKASIIVNGEITFYSHDGVSCPIIWNNVLGLNFSGKDYDGYLSFMKTQGIEDGTLEFAVDEKVIRKVNFQPRKF